jgi:hypothetical protein
VIVTCLFTGLSEKIERMTWILLWLLKEDRSIFLNVSSTYFILKNLEKDVYQNGQKYFSNTSSLRKHQSPALFLFELAVFLLLSDRSAGTNSSPHAYSLSKGSPSLWWSS